MKQPHTEESIEHTDDEQDTGNHKVPGQPDTGGADQFGGSRAGAENFESGAEKDGSQESIESGTDVDRVSGLDQPGTSTKAANPDHERKPERDENGRM